MTRTAALSFRFRGAVDAQHSWRFDKNERSRPVLHTNNTLDFS